MGSTGIHLRMPSAASLEKGCHWPWLKGSSGDEQPTPPPPVFLVELIQVTDCSVGCLCQGSGSFALGVARRLPGCRLAEGGQEAKLCSECVCVHTHLLMCTSRCKRKNGEYLAGGVGSVASHTPLFLHCFSPSLEPAAPGTPGQLAAALRCDCCLLHLLLLRRRAGPKKARLARLPRGKPGHRSEATPRIGPTLSPPPSPGLLLPSLGAMSYHPLLVWGLPALGIYALTSHYLRKWPRLLHTPRRRFPILCRHISHRGGEFRGCGGRAATRRAPRRPGGTGGWLLLGARDLLLPVPPGGLQS